MQIEPYLSSCTKFNFKGIKDLSIILDILSLREQYVGNNLELMGTGHNFLNRTTMVHAIRSTIDKLDPLKLKSFCNANIL